MKKIINRSILGLSTILLLSCSSNQTNNNLASNILNSFGICKKFNIEDFNKTNYFLTGQMLKEPQKNYVSPEIPLVLDTGYFLDSEISKANKTRSVDFTSLNLDFFKEFSEFEGDYIHYNDYYSSIYFYILPKDGKKTYKDLDHDYQFSSSIINIVFKDECNLNKFLEKYKIKKYKIQTPGYGVRYDLTEIELENNVLDNIDIKELKNNLKKYNSLLIEDEIVKIKFSSIHSIKVLNFLLKAYFESKDLFEDMSLYYVGDLNFYARERLLGERK